MAEDIVLVVDDDNSIVEVLCKVLRSNGFVADTASSGFEALDKIEKTQYSCILMDINMDGIDGFEVISRIRKQNITTPIVVVSGRKEDYDTIYGLDIGADDYITKPFNPITLGAKVKAIIRRYGHTSEDQNQKQEISAGPFVYDLTTLRLYKNGEEIPLTAKENSIMKLFMDNENHIFSRDTIYEIVWNHPIMDDSTVVVYINRLRQKIEDDPSDPRYIQNVRGLGYRFIAK